MKLLLILPMFFSLILSAQNKFQINVRSSLIYFTLNEDASETFGRSLRTFAGPNWVNEISATVQLVKKNKFNVEFTSGYVLFWNLEASTWSRNTNLETYIPIRLGVDYKLFNWLRPSCEISNYVLTSRKRGEEIRNYPDFGPLVADSGIKTFYTNIDLGFKIVLNRRSSMTISTPITILPMFHVKDIGLLDPVSSGLIDMIAGNKGFNVQYSYGF